jgi:hypothetical protein
VFRGRNRPYQSVLSVAVREYCIQGSSEVYSEFARFPPIRMGGLVGCEYFIMEYARFARLSVAQNVIRPFHYCHLPTTTAVVFSRRPSLASLARIADYGSLYYNY